MKINDYCLLFLFLFFILVGKVNAKVINGIVIPDDINAILDEERQHYANACTSGCKTTDSSIAELDEFLKSNVKYDATSFCQNCGVYFPVSSSVCRIFLKKNESICLDGYPEKIDYCFPPECPYCKGILPLCELNKEEIEQVMGHIWYPCYQMLENPCERYIFILELISKINDLKKSEIYFKYALYLNNADSKTFLQKSLEYLDNYILNQKKTGDSEEIYFKGLLLQKIELLRQIGNFQKALECIEELTRITDEESYYKILLNAENKLVKNKITSRTLRPFGNQLHIAIQNSDIPKLKLTKETIISLEKQFNCNWDRAIFQAIKLDKYEWVNYLVSKDKNLLQVRDYHDNTPLHIAAKMGNVKIINLLLKHGSNIEAINTMDHTPLFLAVRYGKQNAVEALLKHGADFNKFDYVKYSPLQYACINRSSDSEKLFFKLYNLQKNSVEIVV